MKTIWTREKCAEEAAKYPTRTTFAKGRDTAYHHALKNGWIDDYDWMTITKGIYKDPEKCRDAALQYKTRSEFLKGNSAAYYCAVNNGWLDSYDWMPKARTKKKREWNEETCRSAAEKCSTIKEFEELFPSAYSRSLYCGWMKNYTWFERPQKPKKWNEENSREAALQCKNRTEFRSKFDGAYWFASENNLLDTYDWFETYRKPAGWWDDPEHVKEESKRYSSRLDFAKGSPIAHKNAVKNGWIDSYTWLKSDKSPQGWWNDYEKCFNVAKLCKNVTQMQKEYKTAYTFAVKNGWIKDYDWFPKKKSLPKGYWNDKEHVITVAKLCDSRHDFFKKYSSAYSSALKHGWIDEFDWFGEKIDLKNGKIDQVYAYEFINEHAVYVGRTLMRRSKIRDREHVFKNKDVVYQFAKEHDIAVPEMKVLEDNLTIEDGRQLEGVYLEKYKQDGWQILNKAKTGSIGGLLNRLSKKKCTEKSKLCSSIEDFRKKYPKEYWKSKSKGWIDHFDWIR